MAYKDSKTGKWISYWSYKDLSGTYKRKRKYGFKRKSDAEQYEREMENKHALNSEIDKTALSSTINDICSEYLQSKFNTVKDSTYKHNLVFINNHILPSIGKYRALDLNNKLIVVFRNELLDKGLSNQRVNQVIKKLKEIYMFFCNNNNIIKDPFKTIKRLTENNSSEINFFTLEEFDKYIKVVDDLEYYTFFTLLYFSGLRKGEALALNWNDIDFDNNIIKVTKTINQKIKNKKYLITEPKNKSSIRNIKLDDTTMNQLKKLYYNNKLYTGFNKNTFVFGINKPLAETTLQKRHEKYTKLSKSKTIRIHDFRHSHASLLINTGSSILRVANRLGHAKKEMTLNTYSHLYADDDDKLVDNINRLQKTRTNK